MNHAQRFVIKALKDRIKMITTIKDGQPWSAEITEELNDKLLAAHQTLQRYLNSFDESLRKLYCQD